MEETKKHTKANDTDQQVGDALQSVIDAAQFAVNIHKLGGNSDLAQFFKDLIQDQHGTIIRLLNEQGDRISFSFIAFYLGMVNSAKLTPLIHSYAFDVKGLNVSLWAVLKESEDFSKIVSKFHNLYFDLRRNTVFKNLNIDFSVIEFDEDLNLPTSFKVIEP